MSRTSWAWAVLPLLGLFGCQRDELLLIPGTTTRVGEVAQAPGTELQLRLFREVSECVGAGIARDHRDTDRLDLCLPHVDRRAGEVRMGFDFRKDDARVALPLEDQHLRVIHQGTIVQNDSTGQHYTVIPHDPVDVNQLFVLLIDGSQSMNEMADRRRTRMEQVKSALKLREVQDAFFPEAVRSAVLLFEFTQDGPKPVGGSMEPLQSREDYLAAVSKLRVLGGYTHLYDAVEWASGPMLDEEAVRRLTSDFDMEVTLIALTDGFNNQAARDTCGTNAPRLERLIESMSSLRDGQGARLRRRPRVFTVGLGRPTQGSFELPRDWNERVRPRDLCGRNTERRIDGDLERIGIDNASLEWIAAAGNGAAYVKQGRDGLGEAFASSAARRYRWFEVRYRLDPFYLRRAFTTRLRLMSFYTAEAAVSIHPSAWLDAPPGEVNEAGWTEPQSYAHTMVVLTPILGLLMALGYLGAAVFNTRRALSGRNRRGGASE